jgi:tetratricopeptide (TPR) repeat protein
LTGLASPVVRRKQTADRLLVARQATLLVDKDFGLVGTIGTVAGDKVDVLLRGGKLGVPLDHWAKKGDIFAVSQIVSRGSALRAYRREWTLLQVAEEPKDGVCKCQLFNRWDNPLPSDPRVLGYRCLKLGTTQAPLRLRIVSDDPLKTPWKGLRVEISAQGFQGNMSERTATNGDGLIKSEQAYQNVAFVRLFTGANVLARVPVEILDERVIAVPVSIQPDAERKGELSMRLARWLRRIGESLEVAATLVRELNAVVGQSTEAALARARTALKTLQTDLAVIREEREKLRKEGEEIAKGTPLDFAEGDQRLKILEARQKELADYITNLEKIVVEEKDPKRQKWKELIQKARLLEGQAEYDQAIQIYDQVIAEAGPDPNLQPHVDELKAAWMPKDDKHDRARRFIYQEWSKLERAIDMKAKLGEAREAFETFKGAGDFLSPRMLLKVNVALSARLDKEVETLRPEDSVDDEKTVKTFETLVKELQKLNNEVGDYLKQAAAPKK